MKHAATILDNIVETLRTLDDLSWVSLGNAPSDGAIPNACVYLETIEPTNKSTCSDQRRLEATIEIRTSSDHQISSRARATDLAELAAETLMEDPTRDGLCQDLPAGDATSIDSIRITGASAKLSVICLFDQSGDACEFQLDGETLFDSGHAELELSSWIHKTLRRDFPGLDGELIMPLGRRSRTLTQRGTLSGATQEILSGRIEKIMKTLDGQLHHLTDDGQFYQNLLVERFTPGTIRQTASRFSCDYQIDYRELVQ